MKTFIFARHRGVLTMLALASVITIAGCTAVTDSTGSAPASGATPSATSSPIDLDAPAPEPTVEAGAPTGAPELVVTRASIDEAVTFETGVSVSLRSVRATTVEAETPGEVAGPAVVVELVVTNDTDGAVDVGSAVVNLVADDGQYGVGTTAGSDEPLAGSISPGESVTASYVFMLDPAGQRTVTVSVNYAAGQPIAEFTGKTN